MKRIRINFGKSGKFGRVPLEALMDNRITDREFRVLAAYASFADRDGIAHPKRKAVSERLGGRFDGILHHLSAIFGTLKRRGWIEEVDPDFAEIGGPAEKIVPATGTPTVPVRGTPTVPATGTPYIEQTNEQTSEQNKYPARGAGRCDARAFDAREMELPPYVSRRTWNDLCNDKIALGRPIDHGYAMDILGRLRELHKSGNDIDAVIDEMIAASYKYPRAI